MACRKQRWAQFWQLAGTILASVLLCGCPGASITPGTGGTGEELLKQMKTAYQQAKTYADAGELRIVTYRSDGTPSPREPIPMSVTFERPNKLRLEALGASVVC